MVTNDYLKRLHAGRDQHTLELEHTIGGTLEQNVHGAASGRLEQEIAFTERAFRDAQRSMRIEQAISSHQGLPKAHFNNPKREIKP